MYASFFRRGCLLMTDVWLPSQLHLPRLHGTTNLAPAKLPSTLKGSPTYLPRHSTT